MKRMEGRPAIRLVVVLLCCPCASALNPSFAVSQYAHKAWTVREGFFKGQITAIAQTPDGYLWLGTEFGLFRFDGVRSVAWTPPAGERLPGTFIQRLLAARDGRLWIATRTGLASWKDGRLTGYPELAGHQVDAVMEDRQGEIWIGTIGLPTGMLCAIRSNKAECSGQDGRFGSGVYSLYEYKGDVWAGADTGLWRWKPGAETLYPISEVLHEIPSLIEGDNGALWLGMHSGIEQLVDGKIQPYPFPAGLHFYPLRMLRDREGGLWIGTPGQGVVHVHQGRTDVFTSADGLSGDFVKNFFEDREGNVWIGTSGGLDRFRDFAAPTISAKQGLSSDNTPSVLAGRDGSVWIGSTDGLNRWNAGRISIYRKRDGLPDDGAHTLFEDDRGRIWVSTVRGIAYFENGRFVPVSAAASRIVHNIVQESTGDVWINDQEQGLLHLLGEKFVERIPLSKLGREDYATALVPDPTRGGLWLGFYKTGVAYYKDGQIRESYGTADGLGEGWVTNLQFRPDGALWATTQGGLSRIQGGRVATLTSKNGLPCDTVHWALEDNQHAFWLYMPCGMPRIDGSDLDAWSADPRHTIHAAVFDSLDGVRSQWGAGGYGPHAARSADGKLWFTTGGEGVSVIDPQHLPVNKLPPPVHIEEITADRKKYETSSHLRLPPLVRDLEIDYTALSFVAPEKIRFEYKLEGRDRDWKDAGNERKAFYNDLPPRNYRFRVKACNNNGVWNEAGASFDFSIDPAYYQTTWFKLSCAAAFLTLLWGLYRYRLYQIAREFNVRLEERVGERTRIARDLHDTLLQSFQGLMLRLQVVDDLLPAGRAKEQLELSLERADQAIAEGRSAVHDLRSSTTLTNELAQAVRGVADELAGEGSPTFRLVVEGPVRELHPILRDEVYRIAREALRNSFSHARAHHVEAEITYGERLLRLRIRDDGAGIPPDILEAGRTGHYGLNGIRERARQIGASLDIWSGVGTGTEVDLSVPGAIAYNKSPRRPRLQLFRKKVG
jgi:ligand-binding sensor domain-containing protein/signal transduction histidine kinase